VNARPTALEPPNGRNTPRHCFPASAALSACSAFTLVVLITACGKKGPPLPPLVRMPAAPAEIAADRRGNTVDLQFVVPSTNTDGTRPANVSATEVYAITAPPTATPPAYSDAQMLKYGTRIASVSVKAPRDPNLTADPDEPGDEVEAPEGTGLDQGVTARVSEAITTASLKSTVVRPDPQAPPTPAAAAPVTDTSGPLLAPPAAPVTRTYAAVGVSTRGKHGPFSRRVTVPLVPPPPPPAAPTITYDETKVTVTWPPIADSGAAASDGVLPSRVIGTARPEIAYTVYDVSAADAPSRLTAAPLADAKYEDTRIEWGVERCYAVRTSARVAGALIESDASPPACETLTDTFPPAAPKGLGAIASGGAINLIWEPNTEKDLAGYLVMRGTTSSGALQPITPSPIQETSFRDGVQPGTTYVYAVKAVDRAGNSSEPSARVTETAR
jgi:predicted small lipoprotein YifL